jgi:UDP-N-acetylmuramyl pentapeptide synthase
MMLQFSEEYEMAIIEIGTNEPGEIAILSKMLAPNYGLITNIGKEHLELLKDLDEVEIEETFLFGQLLKTGGNCFINYDDERLKKYAKIITNNITYGTNSEADFVVDIEFDDFLQPTLKYKIPHLNQEKKYSAKINSVGLAIGLNAIAAATVGFGMGLSGAEISRGLESFEPTVDGYARMVIEEINGIKILNDCYNANPSSMEMSLKSLSMLKNFDNKIAILGDMFELGDSANEEHINIINLALDLANEVIVIGRNMTKAANEINSKNSTTKLKVFDNFSEIAKHISNFNHTKTVALVKASRGMEFEKLIESMKK